MNAIIAGTGTLGKAVAYRLLTEGYGVVINSRSKQKVDEQKAELSKFGRVEAFEGDLAKPAVIEDLFSYCNKTLGEITCVVITLGGFVEDTVEDPRHLSEMLENHVVIPTRIISVASKWLKYGSSVILISSIQSMQTTNWNSLSYVLGKNALNKLVENSAANLVKKGIRVNAVAPAVISSDFTPGRDWRKLRKIGDLKTPPEEIASVISFLAGTESVWITGVTIRLDGGHWLVSH